MQRYLLDTNILMYILNDTGEMTSEVEDIVGDFGNRLFMSAASIRELVANWCKYAYMQKQWRTPDLMFEYLYDNYFIDILYPHREHYHTFIHLEWNIEENHRDTTDLIIIAHAITEKLTLISSDRKFPFYRNQGLNLIYNRK
ncbi:MAG: PIN domain-containing protein [Bacteroidaceae bacterium]|nr:PIN domain-containing protein [Bacteroidaceae bacterium]